jgi:hypothetical protein
MRGQEKCDTEADTMAYSTRANCPLLPGPNGVKGRMQWEAQGLTGRYGTVLCDTEQGRQGKLEKGLDNCVETNTSLTVRLRQGSTRSLPNR